MPSIDGALSVYYRYAATPARRYRCYDTLMPIERRAARC